jgi:hypothetical protein
VGDEPVDILRRHHSCGLAIGCALTTRSGTPVAVIIHPPDSTTEGSRAVITLMTPPILAGMDLITVETSPQ